MSAHEEQQAPELGMEIIGFRQWRVDDDLRLTSTHKSEPWEPGWNTAVCRPVFGRGEEPHPVPGPSLICECGLYALHSPNQFWYTHDAERPALRLVAAQKDIVAGIVAARGRVEVHHSGFRAEQAKVVAIAVPSSKRLAALARAVAAEYAVPAVPIEHLEEVAGEYGHTVPESLRPTPGPSWEDEFHALASSFLSCAERVRAQVSQISRSEFARQVMLSTAVQGIVPTTTGLDHRSPSLWGTPIVNAAHDDHTVKPPYAKPGRPLPPVMPKRPRYDPNDFVPKHRGGNR